MTANARATPLTSTVRFGTFFAAWVAVAAVLAANAGGARAFIVGFDVGAALYCLLSILMMRGATPARMRLTARAADGTRPLLIAVAALVIGAMMATLTFELIATKEKDAATLALTIVTLPIAWMFSNIVYAIHYAHLYYAPEGDGDKGGIDFPGEDDPDYLDFCYFAMTLGMTFQTSDVVIKSRSIRRVALGHSLLAFAFNIGVLALSINILSNA